MPAVSRALIEAAKIASNLPPWPIEPSWIVEGNPTAECALLSTSADGLAWTVVWQCSEGRFNWYYGYDETILVLEGSIVIEAEGMPPTRYGPGDVIFFRDGAHAKWHVESRVRKLAFCRKTVPVLIGLGLRVFSKIKRTLSPRERKVASLAG
jgi:uncharacterized cupin superfamily protein